MFHHNSHFCIPILFQYLVISLLAFSLHLPLLFKLLRFLLVGSSSCLPIQIYCHPCFLDKPQHFHFPGFYHFLFASLAQLLGPNFILFFSSLCLLSSENSEICLKLYLPDSAILIKISLNFYIK